MQNKNFYKGFTLFNDIEDESLRNRNRAVIMANIVEQHTKQNKITPKGAALALGYFSTIDEKDRKKVQKLFDNRITEMGYKHASA
jgi:hypothetical protein